MGLPFKDASEIYLDNDKKVIKITRTSDGVVLWKDPSLDESDDE